MRNFLIKRLYVLLLIMVAVSLAACTAAANFGVHTDPNEIQNHLEDYKVKLEQDEDFSPGIPVINNGRRLYGAKFYFRVDHLLLFCTYDNGKMLLDSMIDCHDILEESLNDRVTFLKLAPGPNISSNGKYVLIYGEQKDYLYDVQAQSLRVIEENADGMAINDDGTFEPLVWLEAADRQLESYTREIASIENDEQLKASAEATEKIKKHLQGCSTLWLVLPCHDLRTELLYYYAVACQADSEMLGQVVELKVREAEA